MTQAGLVILDREGKVIGNMFLATVIRCSGQDETLREKNRDNHMTADELRKRFPNASESFVRQNADKVDGVPSCSEHERITGNEPMATPKGTVDNTMRGRVRVKIISFRRRLLDERNLSDKYFVDALVYSGILRGDSPKEVKVEVIQYKVDHQWQEKTTIELTDYERDY